MNLTIDLAATLTRWRWHLVVGAILVGAAGLRVVNLGSVPPPLADEILAIVDLHYLITTGHHFDGAAPGIMAYVVPALDGRFVTHVLGGSTVEHFRVVAALFGVTTVGLLVWLGYELKGLRFGVISAGALAIMPWHIYYSRIFIPASEYLMLTVLALCLELVALRRRSLWLAAASAASGAASIYVYPVAIVSTPLLLGTVAAFHIQDLKALGARRLVLSAIFGLATLTPYILEHLLPADTSVRNANQIIGSKLLWDQNLSISAIIQSLVSTWASYLSLTFIVGQGDPNVTQSIQIMGEVGWGLAAIGAIGIASAIFRHDRTDQLLLTLMAVYPLADALTYFDSWANSLRGLFGSALWAIWIGNGILQLTQAESLFGKIGVKSRLAPVVLAVVLQTVVFVSYYFGPYSIQHAYAFETGYDTIYARLQANGLQNVPVVFHGGFDRGFVLQYFTNYRLHIVAEPLACYELAARYQPPLVYVVREDRGFASLSQCVTQSALIGRDEAYLSTLPGTQLVVIAQFPNDPDDNYSTAIFYVHTQGLNS